jgi:hypothetical protein
MDVAEHYGAEMNTLGCCVTQKEATVPRKLGWSQGLCHIPMHTTSAVIFSSAGRCRETESSFPI